MKSYRSNGDEVTVRIYRFGFSGETDKLHISFYLPDDIIGGDRHPVVIEHGHNPGGIDAKLDHHQALKLSIAVLLDHEEALMSIDEVANGFAEWERANTHSVETDAFFG